MQLAANTKSSCFRSPVVSNSRGPTVVSTRSCRPVLPVVAATNDPQASIDGLSRTYCDDFVCTSSPAIESTVRAVARDLERCNGVWTTSLFSRNVEYNDTFRKFKGLEGYRRLNFISKKVEKPVVTVEKLRMLDIGTAVINWNLTGYVQNQPIDVECETEITMNLLTGQVEKHTERWNLKQCSLPAMAAWTANRVAWTAEVAANDAAENTSSILDSLTSMDDGDNTDAYMKDPNDPMKFFQPKDTFKDDAIFLIGGLALLYAVWQAYKNLLQI